MDLDIDNRPPPSPVLPMDTIPVEILVEILLKVLTSSFPYDPHPRRTNLTLVCHRWNIVIEANPVFWTKISNHDPLSQVRRSLTKSMRLPIDVYARWTDFAHITPEKAAFLELVNCHIDRWRHVTMEIFGERFYPLSVTPAPLLETLAVFSPMGYQEIRASSTMKLFDSAWTPRLREVHIERVSVIDWRTSFPPALSKLYINSVYDRRLPLSELLNIFVRCRGITSVEILGSKVDLNSDHSWATRPPIELPALKSLTLWYLGHQVIQEILSRLRVPRECVIKLGCRLPQTNPSTFLTLLLSRYLDDPNDGLIDQLTISIDNDSLRAKGPHRDLTFDLASSRAVRDAMLWFNGAGVADTNGRSQSSTRHILVSLDLDLDICTDYFNLLGQIWDLQCIKRVTLDHNHIALLSQPVSAMTGDGGKQCWAFPGMVELHLHIWGEAKSDCIIGLVERGRASRDGAGAVAPLQRIEFGATLEKKSSDPPPDSLFTLLDVLNEDTQLYWYGERVSRSCL